ncbi:hypothetical protein GR212_34755 [Rhizobium lusitanum]|uniref:Uncharacterized protein n=1 Tax=Rhizobium lusitanum TaxID=293958 RepID=A0A6L9UGG5_9HYPH|nr:hypothetical protein [Rhizobium lusitanum]NEI74704.1 hypothetical protein [Rhizobium lusitanum]
MMLSLLCAVVFRLAHFEVSRIPQRHIDMSTASIRRREYFASFGMRYYLIRVSQLFKESVLNAVQGETRLSLKTTTKKGS